MNPWRLATSKMERSLLNLAECSHSKLQGVTSWVHPSRIKPVSTNTLQEPEDPHSNHPCESTLSPSLYSRGPQAMGRGAVVVWGLLRTESQSRRQWASKLSFICCSPSLAFPPEPSPAPQPQSMEKPSSSKLVPGAKKAGKHGSTGPRGPKTAWKFQVDE